MGAADADVTLDPGVLIPASCRTPRTGEVLMVAWQDAEALAATRATGLAHFHSRSRGELWQKGATSGNTMRGESTARVDCDGDTVLLRVEPAGPACHTGAGDLLRRRADRRPAGGPGRARRG